MNVELPTLKLLSVTADYMIKRGKPEAVTSS